MGSRMKVIFLDIDGVLINKASLLNVESSYVPDEKCVQQLNELINRTDAKIVVSSCWRIGRSRLMKAYLLKESLDRLWNYRYPGAMMRYLLQWMDPVSYTHLDVYKRQLPPRPKEFYSCNSSGFRLDA